jgi:SAM-dependent methyltransferase
VAHGDRFLGEEYTRLVRMHYDERLSEYGEDVRSLYWSGPVSQQTRFGVFLKAGDLSGRSVLDVGCGFGDLYGFLREHGVDVEYHGVDLNPNMVEIAQNRYPDAHFAVANILDGCDEERRDYVFESGVLTQEHQPWYPFVTRMLRRMFELANVAVGFNMQSAWIPDASKLPKHVNFDPLHWIDFCRCNLSKRVVFLHDYFPHDFTIFVYKEPFQGEGH